MKKLLLILALRLALPSIAYAKCDGGTEIEGKNKHVYCVSNQEMNWWSVFAWCKANERPLATMDQACHYKGWTSGCTNLTLGINKSFWSSLAFENNKAYIIDLNTGNTYARSQLTGYHALCF